MQHMYYSLVSTQLLTFTMHSPHVSNFYLPLKLFTHRWLCYAEHKIIWYFYESMIKIHQEQEPMGNQIVCSKYT